MARLAMADKIVLNCTNTELLAGNIQKKRQIQYIEIQYDGQDACVLSLKDVKKRRQQAEIKKKDKKVKKLV